MGAKQACCSKPNLNRELNDVPHQSILMDNSEVRIMKIEKTQMANPKNKKVKQVDGFCQRDSFQVIPLIDRLKRDKMALKRQMSLGNGEEVYTRFRIVSGGKEIMDKKQLVYVSPL